MSSEGWLSTFKNTSDTCPLKTLNIALRGKERTSPIILFIVTSMYARRIESRNPNLSHGPSPNFIALEIKLQFLDSGGPF